MFAIPAITLIAGAAPAGPMDTIVQLAPFGLILVVGYFMLWRPQQQRMKAHQEAVAGIKRGDTVVLNSGMIGKVVRVEDAEIGMEIAQGVTVKVVKSMVQEVRTRGAPAPANDAKS
jgi:preprotein translocase subunit YajC